MKKKTLVDKALLPSGVELTLTEEMGFFLVRADGMPLMSNMAHHSEERMAVVGCETVRTKAKARVLVGGLGMGYTARAALDQLGPDAEVVVAEISPQLVAWNRGPLADLAKRPLEDPRLTLEIGDIVEYLTNTKLRFDAILLDLDHGPDSFTTKGNARLYSRKGLARIKDRLRPLGTLIVWSAYEMLPFKHSLTKAGFDAKSLRTHAREGRKGGRHTLFLGRLPEPGGGYRSPLSDLGDGSRGRRPGAGGGAPKRR